jgi:hypothetical protein
VAADTTNVETVSSEQNDSSADDDRRASENEETVPGREETRLFRSPLAWFDGSQVKGDTIRVLVRDRSVDTVFVRSGAFAAQYDSVSTRVQQLTGQTITAVFRRDSIRNIIAEPNARAIRFLTGSDGTPNGAAKTSSDRIVLRFKNDEVERVSVLGGTETTYYKEAIVPEPFQLEGYIWTPDAKPEKSDFLREPRVRERLNLPPMPEPVEGPDTTAPDSATAPADSALARSSPRGPADSETETGGPSEPGDKTDAVDTVEPQTEQEPPNATNPGTSGSADTSSLRRVETMPARRDTSTSMPRQ